MESIPNGGTPVWLRSRSICFKSSCTINFSITLLSSSVDILRSEDSTIRRSKDSIALSFQKLSLGFPTNRCAL
jgi:hypothetical protein